MIKKLFNRGWLRGAQLVVHRMLLRRVSRTASQDWFMLNFISFYDTKNQLPAITRALQRPRKDNLFSLRVLVHVWCECHLRYTFVSFISFAFYGQVKMAMNYSLIVYFTASKLKLWRKRSLQPAFADGCAVRDKQHKNPPTFLVGTFLQLNSLLCFTLLMV